MANPLILVTNDDGINAPGIRMLYEAMAEVGEAVIFAPDSQKSSVGHGISLHHPLRVHEVRDHWHAVSGTPADCVMLAVRDLLGRKPDLVVSGINDGPNLGDDVTYSGTVAGAYEGMLMGVPAIAFSSASYTPLEMETAARVATSVARHVLANGLPPDTMLNVNVPDLPFEQLRGAAIARMGRRHYQAEIVRREDPRGSAYYWIGGPVPSHIDEEGTDFAAIEQQMVSITPLGRDLTQYGVLEQLRRQPVQLA